MQIRIDPYTYTENGTATITNITFNQNSTMLAYAISYNGSDWQNIKIKNLVTGEDYPETLKWCKFSNIAWSKDHSGFFYTRYPNANFVLTGDESNYNKVYWHRIGSPQEADELIYEDLDHKELDRKSTRLNSSHVAISYAVF